MNTTSHPPTPPTGSVTYVRGWFGAMRSAFGKPTVIVMDDDVGAKPISHPSLPVTALLATIPTLRFATPDKLKKLAEVTTRHAVGAGEAVTEQGDEDDDDVCFVIDGTFEVLISHFGHSPDFIRELHSGDSFGELGVLYAVPRTATVVCTSAGHILRIPGRAFMDSLETGG